MTATAWPPRQHDDTVLSPPHWTELALCTEVDGELFFPEQGVSARPAKAVCSRCEVRTECLEYALQNDVRFGVFGGLSERERRKLKRSRGEAA